MIKPTIGRVVWVIRPLDTNDFKQPEVGFVTYVHDDHKINVAGFDHIGKVFRLAFLHLIQDGEPKPEGDFACWMPYQKGQAAKLDALELAAATLQT